MRLPARVQNLLTTAHVHVYRTTGGRLGGSYRGAPMLLLDHVGRRTGARRTTPLIYARDGEDLVLVASNGGAKRAPAWFHNITAAGEAKVRVGGERRAVTVSVAPASERSRLWPKAAAVWPLYDDYQRRTEREIPIVVLSPRGARESGRA
jgi:deazaflavin-dependent oxidoreductase (nitroreductase family)